MKQDKDKMDDEETGKETKTRQSGSNPQKDLNHNRDGAKKEIEIVLN